VAAARLVPAAGDEGGVAGGLLLFDEKEARLLDEAFVDAALVGVKAGDAAAVSQLFWPMSRPKVSARTAARTRSSKWP